MTVLLFLVTLLTSSLPYSEGVSDSGNNRVVAYACDSATIASDSEQEESTEVVKDSVEDSSGVNKWKEGRLALSKAFQFRLSQYTPPSLEKEQRPPQFILA
jgi:hypothetical protein